MQANHVNTTFSLSEIKENIARYLPNLISRIERSKNHVARSNIHKDFQSRHQKVRRIPINLPDKNNIELKKLSDEKHKIKLSRCPDKYFISLIVVNAKKDQTIKLGIDLKILKKAVHTNNYRMSNIETLIEFISQQINAPSSYFSTLDLKYACSQFNLDLDTANKCSFNIINGDITGTYRFQIRFYGLTDMPSEFQKAMNCTLISLKNTYCFLDYILIFGKRLEEDHKPYVLNCLKWLDDNNLRINLPKCYFSKLKIDWLRYHISQLRISPIESQTSAMLALEAPKTLEKLRSFLGSEKKLRSLVCLFQF